MAPDRATTETMTKNEQSQWDMRQNRGGKSQSDGDKQRLTGMGRTNEQNVRDRRVGDIDTKRATETEK